MSEPQSNPPILTWLWLHLLSRLLLLLVGDGWLEVLHRGHPRGQDTRGQVTVVSAPKHGRRVQEGERAVLLLGLRVIIGQNYMVNKCALSGPVYG